MAADPFHVGVFEALYRVIEERVPFGRQIVTITSVLIMFGTIVLISQFLVATLLYPLGSTIPSVISFIRGIRVFGPDWTGIPPQIQKALFYQFTFFFFFDLVFVASIYFGRSISSDRAAGIEKRIEKLETVVGVEDKASSPAPEIE